MSKKETMFQCRMKKYQPGKGGFSYKVGWVSKSLAHEGRKVKVRVDNVWDSGWEIDTVWQEADAKTVRERERAHLTHRKHSDI